jgi:hypothetical protein
LPSITSGFIWERWDVGLDGTSTGRRGKRSTRC